MKKLQKVRGDVMSIYQFRMVDPLVPSDKVVTPCVMTCKQDVVLVAGILEEQRMP